MAVNIAKVTTTTYRVSKESGRLTSEDVHDMLGELKTAGIAVGNYTLQDIDLLGFTLEKKKVMLYDECNMAGLVDE